MRKIFKYIAKLVWISVFSLLVPVYLQAQTNNIVGTLGGEVSVSSMGTATYSIPIEVVPGTKGVQPNLSIVYSSSSGRGYLGCDWHLSGLSSITRVPRTKYPDGSIGTVNLDANDRYALDGVKLMKMSGGSYAATNAVYGTEIENYTRVTLKGTPETSSQYFEAVTDLGQIIEYGNTSDSKQKTANGKVVAWMANKITDADGNYMTITYEKSATNGELWPVKIKYTGNVVAGIAPYAKVLFQYSIDDNVNASYVNGQIIKPTRLLSSIDVKYGDDLVRQYTLEYDSDRSTRLNAVVLKDASGHELTRTVITWGNDDASETVRTYNTLVGYTICIGDYNGDNLPDLFLNNYNSGTNNWQIRLGDRTGNYNNVNYSSTIYGNYVFSAVPVDKYGKDGISFVSYDSASGDYRYHIIKLTSNGHTVLVKASNENAEFYPGDFLGEGEIQVLSVSNPHNNNVVLSVTGINANLTVHKDSKISVTDFNGNGKSDIQVVRGTSVDIYEYNETTSVFVKILDSGTLTYGSGKDYYGDLNGDGKQDYIRFKNGYWYLKMSKGNAYADDQTLPFASTINNDGTPGYPIYIVDINGDGKDDIIQPVHNYNTQITTINIYYSRGFDNGTYNYDTQALQNENISLCGDFYYRFGDLDGDGKTDMLYTGAVQHAPILVSFREKREHDLVSSITNGIGKCSSLQFAYFHSPHIGYLGIEGRRIHYPIVSKHSEPDGIGGVAETTYTYGEATYDFDRRQLMGFGQINTYRSGTNIMMNYEYNDDYHHLNLEHSLYYYLQRGNQIGGGYIGDTAYWRNNRYDDIYYFEIYNTLAYLGLSYSRFIPYYSYSSTIDKLKNSQQMNCCWLNANNGRLEKSSVVIKDFDTQSWVSRDSTAYTYTNEALPNGKTALKISSIKAWNKRKGFSQMPYRYTTYSYNSGRVSTKTLKDSDGDVGVTAYSYNTLGLPLSETYTPTGMTARTRAFVYDNKGRFVIQETNVLGHVQSATFDVKTGWRLTQTDANGLTTSFQYDALGRISETTRPDQTVHHVRYSWNRSPAFANAVYYISETETGRPTSTTYFDVLGRTIFTYTAGRGYNDVVYNALGQVSKTTYVPYSSPTATAGSKKWHIFGYDNYNRVVSESNQYLNLSYSYYDYNNPSMHQYFVTIFDNIRNVQRTTKYDALGRITQSTDAGGSVNYSYSYQTISGKTRDKTTISVGGNTTTVISDIRGNRLSIQDPDAGTVTNTYNVLNQLTSRLDDNGCGTAYSYDLGGRTTQIVYSKGAESETITYTYDNAEGGGIGQLASVKKDGRSDCVYYYDDLGRLIRKKVYDGGSYYNHQYEYNSLGQLQYFTYPDSYRIENIYNSFGELKQINDASDNSLIYAVDSRNLFRRPTTCRYGNGTGVVYSYNAYGMLTGIKNGDVVEGVQPNVNDLVPEFGYTIDDQYRMLSYTYNDRGFIASRSDAKVNQTESYYYDNLDRLTSYKVNGTTAASYTYGNTGNMLTNSRVGAYSYGADKPHAVTGITGNIACPISASQCDVTYNLRNKPSSIIENGNRIAIDYDAAGMRRHTWHYRNNVLNNTTAIISNVYELSSGTSRKLDYIYADGQPVAVHVKRGTADSLYYLMTDHLGSWNKVMDEDKNIVQQTHFDPWGNRMSYTAWNTPQTQTSFPFSRGFTGHEHYDRFKIINANARLYDPVIGRFFSPDPFVQAPDFTQNYNRYSYCLNNPVMYSDPTGEVFGIDDLIAAAVLGAIFNSFTQIVAGNVNNVGDFFLAAGIGALSGAAGTYVSSAVGGAIKYGGFISGAASGAASGATSGFIAGSGNAWMQGKSFGQGLKEGGIAAGIGLGSGALLGGLTQGYIDNKQGYSFWDGTKTIGTETVSIASNAEPITQLGDDDCLTAAIEWTDHTLGGNMTYGEANSFIDYGKNGALDLKSVYNYCSNKGYPLSYISEDASAAYKYYAVYSKIKNGGRVLINENLGHVSGHAVGVRSVTRTLYLSSKGVYIPRYSFNVMDPFWGDYYNITQRMVRNAYNIILIL